MVEIKDFLISLRETIENLGTISVIAIILIIIVLIILMIIEKRLQKKIVFQKDKNNIYLEKINVISGKNPEEVLRKINSLARDFFRERFGIKKSIGYSEVKNVFTKNKNKKVADFCETMNAFLYSGKKIDSTENKRLANTLITIIKENPLQKSVEKKQGMLTKIKSFVRKKENLPQTNLDKT